MLSPWPQHRTSELNFDADGGRELIQRIKRDSLLTFIGHSLIAAEKLDVLVEYLTQTPASIAELAAFDPGWQLSQVQATCMWLLKYGVLEIESSR